MAAELAGDKVNLSWLDANETLKIRAFDARKIGLISLDWQRPNQPEELSILSAPAPINGITERELSIVADSPTYQLQIRLIGAETALQFRDALIEIPSPRHTLTIHWRGWRVDIYSLQSPFEVRALAGSEMLRINCYQEALTVDVFADSINVDVKRLSRLLVNRSSSFPPSLLRVNGAQISSPLNDNNESNNNIIDLAELLSRQLHLALSRDGNQNNSSAAVLADARNSQLKLARANRTTATLTALRHFVEMLGGQPQLQLLAGNVSVRMSAGHDEEIFFLDTKILPRELLEPEATLEQDPFGIGWFLELRGDVFNGKGLLPSSSSTTEETTTTEVLEEEGESTMQMAPPSELFNFRHSFPTTNTSLEIEEDKTNISQDLDSFPSPNNIYLHFHHHLQIFLLDTQNVNLNNSTIPSSFQPINNNSFPISATISALQIPPNLEENQKVNEAVYEDFPGIRRENRPKPEFIWRPEENQKDEKINDQEEEDEENDDILENKNISFNEKLRKKRRDAKTTNFDLIERVEDNKLENNNSGITTTGDQFF
uniref:Uncharacterized protein n=1 Tax=Meloidogyne enterolobii TaxID=390850 RepID=A0A6V7W0Y4_MELEN|nr:unnamed protein product [Meloidogyne enterolobii]